MRKGQEEVEVHAPVVVSNCGIFTTFQKLLPPEVGMRTGGRHVLVKSGVTHLQTHSAPLPPPDIQERLNMMQHGRGSFLVFSGFDGTEEELGLESTNYWLFKNNDMDKS